MKNNDLDGPNSNTNEQAILMTQAITNRNIYLYKYMIDLHKTGMKTVS